MALMSDFSLCFGLPLLLLLPGGAISSVRLPTYSCSRLFTCSNPLSLTFLHLSVIYAIFIRSLMFSSGTHHQWSPFCQICYMLLCIGLCAHIRQLLLASHNFIWHLTLYDIWLYMTSDFIRQEVQMGAGRGSRANCDQYFSLTSV